MHPENILFSPLVEQAIELAAQWHDSTYRKSRWRDPAFDPPDEAVLRVPVVGWGRTQPRTQQPRNDAMRTNLRTGGIA